MILNTCLIYFTQKTYNFRLFFPFLSMSVITYNIILIQTRVTNWTETIECNTSNTEEQISRRVRGGFVTNPLMKSRWPAET